MKPKRLARILLVEDSNARSEALSSWVPANIRVVWVKSGGDAIGVLARDGRLTYAGVMLDHDLHQQLRDQHGRQLTGADVARKIAAHVEPDTPILVHSMNPDRRGDIVAVLESAGFSVTRVPMRDLDARTLRAWLEQVLRVHRERGEEDDE